MAVPERVDPQKNPDNRFTMKSLIHALRILPVLLAVLLAVPLLATEARGFDHDHRELTAILQRVVDDGMVDYEGLKKNPTALESYLDTLAAVEESEFDTWSQDQQLAFLINLYNAATLELIVDHYPVASIKKIGNIFKGPWKQEVVDLFGEKTTLDHLEHGIMREEYTEPRVHFALVCAAHGCPLLRTEAYTAGGLDAELEEQGRVFLRNEEKNRVDHGEGVLYLSPIFDWFEGDFTAGGRSLGEFVAPYFADERDRAAAASGELDVTFTDYDWSLNDQ